LLALLALAACGDLPQPFKPGDKQANPLLIPPDGGDFYVLTPRGLTPSPPQEGAYLIAEGLVTRGLRASAIERSALSYMILLTTERSPPAEGGEALQLTWQILAPSGAVLQEVVQPLEAAPGAWTAGDPDVWRSATAQVAPQIAGYVLGPQSAPAQAFVPAAAEATGPPIAVAPILGAPGDGSISLRNAMETLLAREGLKVVSGESLPDALWLEGLISVTPPQAGSQIVTLNWFLFSKQGGELLGDVSQSNQIRAGSLDGPWGEVAGYAAIGAVEGLMDLLRRTGRLQ